jgi:hypothetical protein
MKMRPIARFSCDQMIEPTVIYISVKAAARNVVRECVTVHHCDFIESHLRDAFQGSVELFGSWWKGLAEQEFNRLAKSGTCEVVRAMGSQDLPVIHALSRFENESDTVPCATYKNVKALVADLVTKMHVRTKTAAVEKRLHAILKERHGERFTFMGWSIKEGLIRAVVPPVEAITGDEPFNITEVEDGYMVNRANIRKTAETPIRVSVYDLICAITGRPFEHALQEFSRLPGVKEASADYKFPGRGHMISPVTDARGATMIMNLLPGSRAELFRTTVGEVLVRYLGGDQSSIDDVSVIEAPTTSDASQDITRSDFAITEVGDGYMLNGMKIRKTAGPPVRVSVYDVMCAITGNDPRDASRDFNRIRERIPDSMQFWMDFKFPGRRQRDTPVTDARGLVMIMNLLPGRQAAQFRMKSGDVLVRYLGGDQTLVSEIQRNAAAQGSLPADNIGRLFGDAVAENAQSVVIAPPVPAVVIESATGFIDMRGPQNYFRLTDSSLWSNVHPCGRPDLVLSPEELAKFAVIKTGSNGECTGRQPTHELALKGSKLLDSVPTKCYAYVEQKARDIWKNMNQLYEGTHAGKTTRDTELLLIKEQMEYNERVSLIQRLVAEAEGKGANVELTLQAEKTKQSEYDAKKADAEAKKADAEARKTEAEESSKKLAMHIDFCNKALSDYGDKITPEMLNKIIDSVVSRS